MEQIADLFREYELAKYILAALISGICIYVLAINNIRRERYLQDLIDKLDKAEKEGKIKCKLTIDSNRKGKLEIWNRKSI